MKKYIYETYYYNNTEDLAEILKKLGGLGFRLIHIEYKARHIILEKEEVTTT